MDLQRTRVRLPAPPPLSLSACADGSQCLLVAALGSYSSRCTFASLKQTPGASTIVAFCMRRWLRLLARRGAGKLRLAMYLCQLDADFRRLHYCRYLLRRWLPALARRSGEEIQLPLYFLTLRHARGSTMFQGSVHCLLSASASGAVLPS